ncbi:hypothetical protein CH63R_01445 [Colletotrichum higginsianum IMI 349063]|uniref:Uncharacterized protein n=1 Tax=Colletotrichum higginsianum (strain IMI 349063) TaxID=759273 RepID=A0A1B7YW34_COLHI|nr:hypothetical protein CH63R_01445 [Colletotrichum higginsianum IMI 349063]OBR16265.1 hypothetical protein CH63R_01445 [Colletotrichum higginsianum IMI 349063]
MPNLVSGRSDGNTDHGHRDRVWLILWRNYGDYLAEARWFGHRRTPWEAHDRSREYRPDHGGGQTGSTACHDDVIGGSGTEAEAETAEATRRAPLICMSFPGEGPETDLALDKNKTRAEQNPGAPRGRWRG